MLDFEQLSYWEKETYINHTDFLIIGSGIVGLSTAFHLKERYPTKKVTVLERGYLPTGASSKNAGFACIGSPSELLSDLKHQSETSVFETVEKRWRGLHYLRQLVGDKALNYKQLRAYELFTNKQNDLYQKSVEKLPFLNEKLKDITTISAVFNVDDSICSSNGFNGFTKAISHAAEGQLDTGKMINALARLAISKGVNVLTGITAKKIDQQTVTTNFGRINFQKAIICTNGFFNQLYPSKNVKPARAQVLITKPIHNLPFKGIYHFDEGFYYFRNINNRVLFGGGRNLALKAEETTTIEPNGLILDELKRYLTENILPNTPFDVDYSWAGIMGVGESKSPFVEQLDASVFCAVRLGGMGVAIGTLVGKEAAELVQQSN